MQICKAATDATANDVVVILQSCPILQAISRGITKSGLGVETVNLEVESTDDAVKAVVDSGGFVIGSPTLGGHMPTQVGSPTLCWLCSLLLCKCQPGSGSAHADIFWEACAALAVLWPMPVSDLHWQALAFVLVVSFWEVAHQLKWIRSTLHRQHLCNMPGRLSTSAACCTPSGNKVQGSYSDESLCCSAPCQAAR